MLTRIFLALGDLSPRIKSALWRHWYQFLASRYRVEDWSFMNYGFEPGDEGYEPPRLHEADEADRTFIQLYDYVASAVDLEGLSVLEVGSGRGGGASYIKRYRKPADMTGLDFSSKAVDFSNRLHEVQGLRFVTGNAEDMPLESGRFDAVINVESSHCYGSMADFVAEVGRVLKPGGHFLFADLRGSEDAPPLRRVLEQSGLTIVKERDITANVLHALDLSHEEKLSRIRSLVPGWLVKSFNEFAGLKGSQIHSGFKDGGLVYMHYVLEKPVERTS